MSIVMTEDGHETYVRDDYAAALMDVIEGGRCCRGCDWWLAAFGDREDPSGAGLCDAVEFDRFDPAWREWDHPGCRMWEAAQ